MRAIALFLLMLLAATGGPAVAQRGPELEPGRTYWYKPEHEQYGRTAFYSASSFGSPQVALPGRTQTFRLAGASRGWAMLEFANGQKAFVHVRILQSILHNPGAADPHGEYRRASVFSEDPGKLEAALRERNAPVGTAGKTAPWRRYKENWTGTTVRKPAAESPEAVAGTSGTPVPGVDKRNRSTLESAQRSTGETSKSPATKPAADAPAEPPLYTPAPAQ